MIISVNDREENIVGKGEIACTSNFSFPHNVFKRLLSQTRQKVSLCGNGLNKEIVKFFNLTHTTVEPKIYKNGLSKLMQRKRTQSKRKALSLFNNVVLTRIQTSEMV